MPKNPSQDLFHLVKSLTTDEKSHLIKNVFEKKDTTYIRLYHLICNQDKYNESLILKQLAEINQAALSDVKYRLYNLVLNNLSEKQKSAEFDLRKMLNRIEFLFGKQLFNQAYEIIKKGEKTCKELENYGYLLFFLEWELHIYTSTYREGKFRKKEIDKLFKEIETNVKKLRSIQEYYALRIQIKQQERISFYSPQAETLKEEYFRHPLLSKEPAATSPDTVKIHYYWCLSSFHLKNQEPKKAKQYTDKIFSLYEKNEALKKNNPFDYLTALNRCSWALLEARDFTTHESMIKKIIDFNVLTGLPVKQYHFTLSYLNQFRNCIYRGAFEEALPLIQECKHKLKQEELNLEPYSLLNLHYCFALVYFGTDSFTQAGKEIAHIINNLKSEKYLLDIQAFARILNVIIYYEKKDFNVLSHITRSAYRFLLKRKILNNFEKIFLKAINKLAYINSREEQTHNFSLLKEELSASAGKAYMRYAAAYFDFDSWIESKISNKNFKDVVKTKQQ